VSGTQLDASAIANDAALVLKLIGAYNQPENYLGEMYVDVVVKINAHMYGSTGVANTAPAP
jgi:hypothetical protein